MIRAVHAEFPHDAFLRDALSGYGALSLTGRGFQIAEALRKHLPAEYPAAVDVLLASASQPHEHRASGGMAAFLYMPHLFFVARHGLDHFEDSMRAQHALTQLFTAEYSIRAFLEKHPEAHAGAIARMDRATRATTCVAWCRKGRGRDCPGRRACAPSRKTRARCSNCWSCSRTTPSCTCGARWLTTSTTSARITRRC